MQAIIPQRKPAFKIVVTPKAIFVEVPRPKLSIKLGRKALIAPALLLLLIVVFIVADEDREGRSKALELFMSLIETILTFFGVSPRSK